MSASDMLENYRAQAENLRRTIERARQRKYLSQADRDRQTGYYKGLLDTLEYAIREMEKSESRNVRYRHRSGIRLDGRRKGHG